MTIVRTTFQAPQLLLHRLKVQAAREQTDVSRLLCKIAEEYLARHEKQPLMSTGDGRALLTAMGADVSTLRHRLPELMGELKAAQKVGREIEKKDKKARAKKRGK